MRFVIKYDYFSLHRTMPIEYESKKKLIKDLFKIWKKQYHNFFFAKRLFIRLPVFGDYKIFTLDEWLEYFG